MNAYIIKSAAALCAVSAIFLTCACGQDSTDIDTTSGDTQSNVTYPQVSIVYEDESTASESTLGGSTSLTVQNTQSTTAATSGAATTERVTEYAYAYAGFSPVIADVDTAQWNLLLVNRDYILPDDFKVDLAEAVPGSGVNMDSRVAPHYAEMYAAAKKDGITLTPLSGYRRISRQKTNFENKIQYYRNQGYSKAEATQLAAKIILPPGTSEHNAGLAMDICSLDTDFDETKEYKWLCENAADYGFILRYTKEKIDVTKITYEPWHWRYVGKGIAADIKRSGMCLEEYLNKQ